MNYPVRGIIEQAKTGLLSIEAATDVINIFIKKSYNEGVVDTFKSRQEVKGGRIKGVEVQTPRTILSRKIKGCFMDNILDQCLFDWDPDIYFPCLYMKEHKTNIGCPNYKEME